MPRFKFVRSRWFVWGLVLLVACGGFWFYKRQKNSGATKTTYSTSAPKRGTITVSVSGSGQVASGNQVDVKPITSGTIRSLNVKPGQEVTEGQIVAYLDSKDAIKAVRDAQISLESARLALEKAKKASDQLTITGAENQVSGASDSIEKLKYDQQVNIQNSQDAIVRAYDDAAVSVSNLYLVLPNIMTKLTSILNGSEIADSDSSQSRGQMNSNTLINTVDAEFRSNLQFYQSNAESDYKNARTKYETNFKAYKSTSLGNSNRTETEQALVLAIETLKAVSVLTRSESNFIDNWVDIRTQRGQVIFAKVIEFQNTLNGFVSQLNSQQTNLTNSQKTLTDSKQTLASLQTNFPKNLQAAENSLKEKQLSLAKIREGADPDDIRNAQLTLQQRSASLTDAQSNLAGLTVRATLSGVVASVDSKVGDQVSNGTKIASIITKQKIAEITASEVDAPKLKVGQKAILTFDAIEDLSLTGSVVELDSVGAVSQGVVSYKVKISLDTQEEKVKPSMSVTAAIITDLKQDALIVPSSAVKSANGMSYVEVLKNGIPSQVEVVVGLTNDTESEVTGNLSESDEVVIATVKSTGTSANTQTGTRGQQSLIPGIGGGGGNVVRFNSGGVAR